MKTISDYLNELQEPYKTQALNNTREEDKQVKVNDSLDALADAFVWCSTQEGFNYWDELYLNLQSESK